MRFGWCVGLVALACASPTPLGPYRIPIQIGPDTVELHTMIASINGPDLVLYDGVANHPFGRGQGALYSDIPYQFTVPQQYPLSLEVNAQYIQDAATRPYLTIPLAPLTLQALSVNRVTISSGTEQRTIVVSDGTYFTESAETQPQLTDLPGPLFVLSSVAGTGLWLPAEVGNITEWQDAMSTFAPSDPTKALFCGAPLISKIDSTPQVAVKVPAGNYQAMQVREIINSCDQTKAGDVLVYEMDRWYVPGLGPVKMTYQAADSKTREYDLVSSQVSGDAKALWPLGQGNRWTYQVVGPDGTIVTPAVDVSVTSVTTISTSGD